jgi:carboxylesterase
MASVEDGFDYLKCFCDQVYLMGLSLGGVLALSSTARLPAQGVIAMSAPFALPPDPRVRFLRVLYRFQPSMPKGPADWQDPDLARDHIDYPEYPTKGFVELMDLLSVMRGSLAAIHQPALLIHSRTDQSVNPENAQKIYDHLGSQDKEILWLEKSGHVVTRDISRQQVFEAAEAFIQRTSQ